MINTAMRDYLKLATPFSMRQNILKFRFWARTHTKSDRVLPDFLVIGAMRAGTSSLFKYLGAHPAIVPSLRKEVGYFSKWYTKGEAWYRCHFPKQQYLRLLQQVKGSTISSFEATPDYLLHPYAAKRAAALVPNSKIIVMLRNPIERAYSHYQHMTRLGFERLSFEEAIAQETHRLREIKVKLAKDATFYDPAYFRYSYFERGLYAEQLERWFSYFPKDQFLILKSEDFFNCPSKSYVQILNFLGLAAQQLPTARNYSYWGAQKSTANPSPKLTAAFRQFMAQQYAPHNQRLNDLLAQDFGWDE